MVLESRPSALSGVCKRVLEDLALRRFSQEDQFAVHLALEEAFNNAIEHGNRGDPNKTVQVDYAIDDHRIDIHLTDQGDGFDPGKVADPRLEENRERFRGRGVLLISEYMDIVEYSPKGNSIHMVRFRHGDPAARS